MEEVLLYNLDNEKGRQIKQLCTQMKIRFKTIGPELYLEPVGVLAGVGNIKKTGEVNTSPSFSDEMILFAGFDDRSLYKFLTRYRQAGIEKVALKAGLTPHNIRWNSIHLRNELKSEHDELENVSRAE